MANRQILFVDDEPLVARLYARAVASVGYESRYAGDGALALEMIANSRPDAVISDMQMPGMSGTEMLRELMGQGIKTMPVLLLSANHGGEVIAAGLDAGADDFLYKGVSFEQLIARLRFWAEGPFAGLPSDARAEAVARLREHPPTDDPLLILHLPRGLLVERAALALRDQLLHVLETDDDFGARPAERERMLGVICGALSLLGRHDPLASLGRADHILAVLDLLGGDWRPRLVPELREFDQVAARATFQHAAASLVLMP